MKLKKALSIATSIALAATTAVGAFGCDTPKEDATPENTYDYNIPQDYARTYYEIFLHSFSDSNGDGVGDIRGLINNLDYLNDGDDKTTTDLGINGIWLMPIHKSPSYHKYDVADYYSVDPKYGTLADFDELVEECEKRGIWVQIDMVLNHTSTQHEWFKQAVQEAKDGVSVDDSTYLKLYDIIEQDEDPDNGASKRTRWQIQNAPGYWYLGQFSKEMPEVDVSNPTVRSEIEKIVDFWLGHGVRSFRLDAVGYAAGTGASYTAENGEFWTWFNNYCNEKGAEVYGKAGDGIARYCYNVAEVWSGETHIQDFIKTGMSAFNYSLGGVYTVGYAGAVNGRVLGYNLPKLVERMQKAIPDDAIMSNFLSNHDNDRSASFFGYEPAKIKQAAALYLLAPGNAYIYYGEEIGMAGEQGSTNTDANRRLPFEWGDSSKGICSNPEGTQYDFGHPLGSWASQTNDADSVLTFYRRAIQLRNRFPEIARGRIAPYALNSSGKLIKSEDVEAELTAAGNKYPNYLDYANEANKTLVAYTLTYGDSTLVILHNIGTTDITADVSAFQNAEIQGVLKAQGGGASQSGSSITIAPGASVVLK